ncbi:MAG TPA: OmpH family outer membrane protein [Planktothrix sp.]|jgi:Skp family chaperone for outer membrane proteins
MHISQKRTAVLISSIAALGFASQAFAQATHPLSIGLVDKDKVVQAYPKAQSAADSLKKSEDKVHKMIEESNKQYEDAKNAHKTPAELEGLQRRLQGSIDDEVKKIQGQAQGLESSLEQEIDSAIKAEAASRKCDTVLMKQAVLVGGVDLTDGVVKRLNAGAAAAPAAASKK